MCKKIFGGIKMTWPRLILFAMISGLITGIIAQVVPDGNSIRQIAVTFEAWIVLAIIVVVNCDKPLEAACKTFVYFLISQPLVYLVQVPFNRLGFGLFNYYWPYWAIWTLATFPGAYIAWYIRRDDIPAALILSVALAGLILIGTDYLHTLILDFPRYLISTVFCYGMVPVLILFILHKKQPRLIAACLSVLALIACLIFQFRGGVSRSQQFSIGLDSEQYPIFEEGWTAELEDPENGTVTIRPGHDLISPVAEIVINDIDKPTGIILTDPDGKTYKVPLRIENTDGGLSISY